jgi:outer membrane protein with beta-barrel domain
MKRLVLLVGFVTLVANSAAAQRSQNIEFGGFGSWWRFDRSFLIKNGFGGGARIGYNLNDRVGLEVTGDYIATTNLAATQDITVSTVSGGLVLNFPVGDQSSILASGGYSRMIFGKAAPYDFTQHLVYGGLGFRLFVSHHVALRGDLRAQYRWDNPYYTNAFTGEVQGSIGASYFFIPPQQGRGFNTNFQWYWGAQGGFFLSKTNTQPYVYDPIVGGHWLITSRRTALYVAYEQALFLSDANAVIFDPNSSGCSVGAAPCRDVAFNRVRRLMFGVLAYPTQKVIEPFGGVGFAIMQILNPVVDCTGCDLSQASQADDRVNDASSKAFFWVIGGLQINYSSKLNVFAQWLMTSSAANFLLQSNTHSLQGGVRVSLGTSKEGITERH